MFCGLVDFPGKDGGCRGKDHFWAVFHGYTTAPYKDILGAASNVDGKHTVFYMHQSSPEGLTSANGSPGRVPYSAQENIGCTARPSLECGI